MVPLVISSASRLVKLTPLPLKLVAVTVPLNKASPVTFRSPLLSERSPAVSTKLVLASRLRVPADCNKYEFAIAFVPLNTARRFAAPVPDISPLPPSPAQLPPTVHTSLPPCCKLDVKLAFALSRATVASTATASAVTVIPEPAPMFNVVEPPSD